MDIREGTVRKITMGPFVDKADGFTPKTALTPSVRVKKQGVTVAARSSGTAITHIENGYYDVEVDATDTNTRGSVRFMATDTANHLPVWEDFNVLAAALYDELYGAPYALTGAGATTATLDAGASSVDGYYNGQLLTITSGTGAGQTRRIIGYVGSTKVATVDTAWVTNPISGSTFRLVAAGSVVLSAVERDAAADALLDRANAIETGLTLRNAMRIVASSTAAKLSGASPGAGTVTARNAVADSKNRLIVTNDANGNRTAITYDLT